MARLKSTWWQRYKYLLHASILILPFWFLYQSMILIFPDSWGEQTMGEFTLAPVSYTKLRAQETVLDIVSRLLS